MSSPVSVMVVDDKIELVMLFRTFLKGSGFNMNSFTDPLLVLEHYTKLKRLLCSHHRPRILSKIDRIKFANKMGI